MTNDATTGPALTPEEWARSNDLGDGAGFGDPEIFEAHVFEELGGRGLVVTVLGHSLMLHDEIPKLMAVANTAMTTQHHGAYKFTPEDVATLRYIAGCLSRCADPELGRGDVESVAYFAGFADRIEALLPPIEHESSPRPPADPSALR